MPAENNAIDARASEWAVRLSAGPLSGAEQVELDAWLTADIRHQGFSPKRSMLLVWENADATLPELYAKKKLKPNPIDF